MAHPQFEDRQATWSIFRHSHNTYTQQTSRPRSFSCHALLACLLRWNGALGKGRSILHTPTGPQAGERTLTSTCMLGFFPLRPSQCCVTGAFREWPIQGGPSCVCVAPLSSISTVARPLRLTPTDCDDARKKGCGDQLLLVAPYQMNQIILSSCPRHQTLSGQLNKIKPRHSSPVTTYWYPGGGDKRSTGMPGFVC